ncbi:hypothetical protein LP421_20350 [Rhizobium sp. RCAM05350]|nr:hypothetical protein LP421_20350 [Rhizobium sp. RCAM05350]
MTSTPIVQFGTSRFLQAHADLFVSERWKTARRSARSPSFRPRARRNAPDD